jgi:hypothetical protein
MRTGSRWRRRFRDGGRENAGLVVAYDIQHAVDAIDSFVA